jgi:hypothetical protein
MIITKGGICGFVIVFVVVVITKYEHAVLVTGVVHLLESLCRGEAIVGWRRSLATCPKSTHFDVRSGWIARF